jgi:hypothetical protein
VAGGGEEGGGGRREESGAQEGGCQEHPPQARKGRLLPRWLVSGAPKPEKVDSSPAGWCQVERSIELRSEAPLVPITLPECGVVMGCQMEPLGPPEPDRGRLCVVRSPDRGCLGGYQVDIEAPSAPHLIVRPRWDEEDSKHQIKCTLLSLDGLLDYNQVRRPRNPTPLPPPSQRPPDRSTTAPWDRMVGGGTSRFLPADNRPGASTLFDHYLTTWESMQNPRLGQARQRPPC